MILLCPPEKSTQFHYPLDPKKIRAEGSIHKDTTYQGSDRQDFYRHGKKKKKQNKKKRKKKKENKQTKRRPRLGLPIGNPVTRPQTRANIFICLLDHAYKMLLANIKMERQRWPEKLLIWGRSGTQFDAMVTELLSSYCGEH